MLCSPASSICAAPTPQLMLLILAALSGGLDSTSIVCVADDGLSAETRLTPRLDTLSYYDPLEPDEDDLYHLRKVEEKRGRPGFHVSLPSVGDSLSFDVFGLRSQSGFWNESRSHPRCFKFDSKHWPSGNPGGTGGDEMNAQALNLVIPIADQLTHLRWRTAGKQLIDWSLFDETASISSAAGDPARSHAFARSCFAR